MRSISLPARDNGLDREGRAGPRFTLNDDGQRGRADIGRAGRRRPRPHWPRRPHNPRHRRWRSKQTARVASTPGVASRRLDWQARRCE